MRLFSPAFGDGDRIPARYANVGVSGGANASIPLRWEEEPAATRSYALAIIDRHPVAHGWVHWLVTDLPASVHSLEEGASGTAMPAGAVELRNSWDRTGYGGPQPPVGSGTHDYVGTLYALDVERLGVGAKSGWTAVSEAMRGHVLEDATLIGCLGR